MQRLQTVLLQHRRRVDTHIDWLFENPLAPDGRLVTFRTGQSWHDWPALARWDLLRLPDHRRRYLTFQGDLSDNRGRVRRVGAGHVAVSRWTHDRVVLELSFPTPRRVLNLDLRRIDRDRWLAMHVKPMRRVGSSIPRAGAVQ